MISVAGMLSVLMCAAMAVAESFSVQAQVSQNDVFVGESFRLEIMVSGSENPEKPDLSGLDGFSVRYLGGQQNSSQSISIVNGRMQRQVRKGYHFAYELVPKRAGQLVIPSIPVSGDGKVAQTQPIPVTVNKPMKTDAFKLRMSLPRKQCYVGEAVRLTVTWYLGQDVRGFAFSLPVLDNPTVFSDDPAVDTSSGGPYYRIPLGNGEVVGKKGSGRLDGKEYATISFTKILIPKEAGLLSIEPAIVSCEALAGYRNRSSRSRGLFDDSFMSSFFNDDFFGRRREGVYQRVSVDSNPLKLQVLPLPADGRPAGFAGHIGKYRIETAATPVDVGVGDPITLDILISGPDYLAPVALPPLDRQETLVSSFRIPSEMADGKVTDRGKLFTQTIRALRPDVQEIPAIELPYFDVEAGRYRVARSAPIPLNVRAVKVVTAEDAEGRELTVVPGHALEKWSAGIAYNYGGRDLLKNQRAGRETWLGSWVRTAFLAVPPAVYVVVLLALTVIRRRNSHPGLTRSRKAMRTFRKSMEKIDPESPGTVALESLRNYLGDKLGIAPSALTFRDVQPILSAKGVDDRVMEDLKVAFSECEAGSYAGGAHGMAADELCKHVRSSVRGLEKEL